MSETTRVDADASLAERLFSELADSQGVVQPQAMTDAWLDSVYERIKQGELPAFVTTELQEAWRILARGTIANMFIRYRYRMGGHRIRRFVPILEAMRDGRLPHTWADARQNREAAVKHAEDRLGRGIESAVLLHGSTLVASGAKTWDQVRSEGIGHVCEAVETAAAMDDEEGVA